MSRSEEIETEYRELRLDALKVFNAEGVKGYKAIKLHSYLISAFSLGVKFGAATIKQKLFNERESLEVE